MSVLPFIDAGVASTVGARLVPPGPALSAAEVAEVVAGLREAAEASVAPVAEVTGLGAPATGEMLVIDRPTWIRANVDMALTMLAEASGEPMPRPERLRDKVAGRANGAQLGGALALLGSRILGQYLPFLAEPHLVLVAPNVAKIERAMGVDHADFRLWVCLHEQTHRQQFARAPWLRGHLIGLMTELLSNAEPLQQWRAGDPPHTLAYRIEGLPPRLGRLTNRWTLQPAGTSTTVTLTSTVEIGSRVDQQLAERVMCRMLARQSEAMLAGLAQRMENARV